jgi:CO dehydrogenase/acetyl-CoA synthase beta subunit
VFTGYVKELENMLAGRAFADKACTYAYDPESVWPRAEHQIVLAGDAGVELGAPDMESVAFTVWTEQSGLVHDGRITVVGPELSRQRSSVPFGKVVLVQGTGFDEENAYVRFQELERIKYRLDLIGYMLHAVPQENKEWARIGNTALDAGLSLRTIGNELIRDYARVPYVDAVEVLLVSSESEDVRRLEPIGSKVGQTLRAMNKMAEKLEYDCANCGFSDVCNEVEGLRRMHRKQAK